MSTIWLGDFRLKQLQQYQNKTNDVSTESKYLVDDNAEYSWLNNDASAQLPLLYSTKADLVIMLGFNDCVYSCAWNNFKIDDIAFNYVKTVNKLTELYPDITFYFCSVNPVDSSYPFSFYKDIKNVGVIPLEVLDKKIKQFNDTIKTACKTTKIIFIDSYNYLTTTSFNTRDGIRYTSDTLEVLKDFILSNFKTSNSNTILSPIRNSEDKAPKPIDDDSYIYWTHFSKTGGLNECVSVKNGSVLPNCVGYAWGRFYEILGSRPNLSADNAELWWDHADGYKRGQTPMLGAVICWQHNTLDDGSDGAGHVAIVEQINPDGSIITSESGWRDEEPEYNPEEHFWVTTRIFYNNNWVPLKKDGTPDTADYINSYKFQGFIYCPGTTAVTKDEIRSENNWSVFTVDDAMKKNAQYIWQYFGTKGWSINAVAALLGNLQHESGMSPGIWESTIEGSTINSDGSQELNTWKINEYLAKNDRYPGYGLVQWTPYSKYTAWCNDGGDSESGKYNKNDTGSVLPFWDIDSQLARIDWEARYNKQWDIAYYNKDYEYLGEKFSSMSFKDFITSTKDVKWLTAAFAFSYEKPIGSVPGLDNEGRERRTVLCETRGADGEFWYNHLKSLPPITTDTQLAVTNFKIDSYTSTSVSASFIVKNGNSGEYVLYQETEDQGTKELLTGTFTELPDGIKTFKIDSKITPVSNYKLKLTVNGTDDKNFSEERLFSTPQDYPESAKSVNLSCDEKLKTLNSLFYLSIVKPDYLGYWKKNSCGYDIQLIVNNKCVKTITINEIKNLNWEKFTIKNKFGYTCKIGDTIQIGVRVWVKDDNGKPVYNEGGIKTSEPICLLNQPIRVYLNTR